MVEALVGNKEVNMHGSTVVPAWSVGHVGQQSDEQMAQSGYVPQARGLTVVR